MNEAELQNLVGAIVRRVLDEQKLRNPQSAIRNPRARILVGVCCTDCVDDEARKSLDELLAANFSITQPDESEFKKRAPREKFVEEHDIVLLPGVGDDAAAKMALGIFDEPVARLALTALALGKPLLAAMHAPYDELLKTRSPILSRVFEQHRRALQNYGFEIIEANQIAATIRQKFAPQNSQMSSGAAQNGRRELITAQQIEALARNGKQLPAGALITPLARDRAKELGLKLD